MCGGSGAKPRRPPAPAMSPAHLHGTAGHASRAVAASSLHSCALGACCGDRAVRTGVLRAIGSVAKAVRLTSRPPDDPPFQAPQGIANAAGCTLLCRPAHQSPPSLVFQSASAALLAAGDPLRKQRTAAGLPGIARGLAPLQQLREGAKPSFRPCGRA